MSNDQYERWDTWHLTDRWCHKEVKFCQSPIFALFFDTEGKMWIGTRNDGLFVRTSQGMAHYTMNPADRNSLPDNNIFDVAVDRHGRIWLATYGGGLVLAKQSATGQISFVSKNNGMPWPKKQFQKVRRIFCSPTGEILVGTTEGLITFGDNFSTPGKMKFFTSQHIDNDSNSISANDIYFIMQHKERADPGIGAGRSTGKHQQQKPAAEQPADPYLQTHQLRRGHRAEHDRRQPGKPLGGTRIEYRPV